MEPHNLIQTLAPLKAPFPPELHDFKPGSTTQDKTRGLALAYVDPRHYQARLDAVDPAWTDAYETLLLGDRVFVVCRLTVAGVTRSDVGENSLTLETHRGERMEENAYTSAVAQAFKRAAAKFGLGRYLYTDVPQTWADLDTRSRRFTAAAVQHLRRQVAQITGQPYDAPPAPAPRSVPSPDAPAPPAPQRARQPRSKGRARTASPAERDTTPRHPAGGNGKGMSLAQAMALVLPFGTKSKPEYKGQTLAALEIADPAFITWAAHHAPGDVRQAAGLIVAARP